MSSILIMIVEGFFKLLEFRRRGEIERGKKEREKRRKQDLCVFGFERKKRGYDFPPWVRLNKDDGFNRLNYYILRSNTITLIWLSSQWNKSVVGFFFFFFVIHF